MDEYSDDSDIEEIFRLPVDEHKVDKNTADKSERVDRPAEVLNSPSLQEPV